MKRAILLMLQHTHNLAEGAGAAALAAALKLKGSLAGKKIVLVQSGGNLSLARLKEILLQETERLDSDRSESTNPGPANFLFR